MGRMLLRTLIKGKKSTEDSPQENGVPNTSQTSNRRASRGSLLLHRPQRIIPSAIMRAANNIHNEWPKFIAACKINRHHPIDEYVQPRQLVFLGDEGALAFVEFMRDQRNCVEKVESIHLVLNADDWSTTQDDRYSIALSFFGGGGGGGSSSGRGGRSNTNGKSHNLQRLAITVAGNILFTKDTHILSAGGLEYQRLIGSQNVSQKFNYWKKIYDGTATRASLRECPPAHSSTVKAMVISLLEIRNVPEIIIKGAMEGSLRREIESTCKSASVGWKFKDGMSGLSGLCSANRVSVPLETCRKYEDNNEKNGKNGTTNTTEIVTERYGKTRVVDKELPPIPTHPAIDMDMNNAGGRRPPANTPASRGSLISLTVDGSDARTERASPTSNSATPVMLEAAIEALQHINDISDEIPDPITPRSAPEARSPQDLDQALHSFVSDVNGCHDHNHNHNHNHHLHPRIGKGLAPTKMSWYTSPSAAHAAVKESLKRNGLEKDPIEGLVVDCPYPLEHGSVEEMVRISARRCDLKVIPKDRESEELDLQTCMEEGFFGDCLLGWKVIWAPEHGGWAVGREDELVWVN